MIVYASCANDYQHNPNRNQSCTYRWIDCGHECNAGAHERNPRADERLVIDLLIFV